MATFCRSSALLTCPSSNTGCSSPGASALSEAKRTCLFASGVLQTQSSLCHTQQICDTRKAQVQEEL